MLFSWSAQKRQQGTKVQLAVDTLGQFLALHVTGANPPDRDHVSELAEAVQEATGQTVTLAFVDQGYTGAAPRQAAAAQGIELPDVTLPAAKREFVLLPPALGERAGFRLDAPRSAVGTRSGTIGRGAKGLHLARSMLMWTQVLPLPGVR